MFTIVNTHEGVLHWCLATIGHGLVVKVKHTLKNPRNLPTWRYNLEGASVLIELLERICPHLRVKRRQAEAALIFLRGRQQARRGSAFTNADVGAAFDLRLANQKSYNKGAAEHVLYRKQPYTREQFKAMLLAGRDGSIYHEVEWTLSMDALVGTDIDRKIAEQLGLKLAQVQRRRVELGLPFFGAITDEIRGKIRALRTSGWTQTAIAKELRIGMSSVQRALAVSCPVSCPV